MAVAQLVVPNPVEEKKKYVKQKEGRSPLFASTAPLPIQRSARQMASDFTITARIPLSTD